MTGQRTQFVHTLNQSFLLWLDHEILDKGGFFTNVSGQLYNTRDNNFPNSGNYLSPYGQWVYDSSISGANIPTGVFVNNQFNGVGISGALIDYKAGGALFPAQKTNVTAVYSVKTFNTYPTSKNDVDLIFNNKPGFMDKYPVPISGFNGRNTLAPCIFIKFDGMNNEPWAFGGQDNTISRFRAIIFSDDEYKLDAVGNILVDAKEKNFLLLTQSPLNWRGAISTGLYFNYKQTVCDNFDPSKLVYISDVEYLRFDARTEVSVDLDGYLGIVHFTLETCRFPRL